MKHSLKLEILQMKSQGFRGVEIARKLGCSPANVSYTLSRHGQRDFIIAALPIDQFVWLEREAEKSEVLPAEMARCLLLDAINDALESVL